VLFVSLVLGVRAPAILWIGHEAVLVERGDSFAGLVQPDLVAGPGNVHASVLAYGFGVVSSEALLSIDPFLSAFGHYFVDAEQELHVRGVNVWKELRDVVGL